jgi:hypothetical protein
MYRQTQDGELHAIPAHAWAERLHPQEARMPGYTNVPMIVWEGVKSAAEGTTEQGRRKLGMTK